MPEAIQRIVGLEKEILSAQTGAKAHFHVVKQFSISHIAEGSSSVSFASYVSREMYEAGKDQLFFITAQIPAAPMSGRVEDLPTWFALQLLKVASGHDFVGATPVYALVDGTAEQAVGPGDEELAA